MYGSFTFYTFSQILITLTITDRADNEIITNNAHTRGGQYAQKLCLQLLSQCPYHKTGVTVRRRIQNHMVITFYFNSLNVLLKGYDHGHTVVSKVIEY